MIQVMVELPKNLAEEIARRAAALGTTPEAWVAMMVQDVAADLPADTAQGADCWIAR